MIIIIGWFLLVLSSPPHKMLSNRPASRCIAWGCRAFLLWSGLTNGESLYLLLWPFGMSSCLFEHFFKISGIMRYFRLCLCFPCPSPEIFISPKVLSFIVRIIIFRKQDMGTMCAYCYWYATTSEHSPLRKLSLQLNVSPFPSLSSSPLSLLPHMPRSISLTQEDQ